MLVWVAAMHCEAKPVIDYYRLKKSPVEHAFDLYQGEQMLCVISGIGKTASAAATAWIAALNRKQPSLAWINLGIAGSAQYSVGTALWVNKITECESNRSFYPIPLIETTLQPAQCLTLNQASPDYQPNRLFDMEASAYFDTASRFSSAELVHCIKIVSDNPEQQTGRDKKRVSQLVAQNIEPLTRFAESLLELNKLVAVCKIADSDWREFVGRAHFSQTQRIQLKKSLQFLLSQNYDIEGLTDEISSFSSSTAIIAHLNKLCQHSSQRL
ncbi:MAG: hypothetical protein ACC663_00270 [Gammaproteobacteria bacterium]